MKKLSNINESVWTDMQKRSSGDELRKEDIVEQDKREWWKYIKLDNPTKYPADKLKANDIIYNLILYKLFNTMNIKSADQVVIFFKNENAWDLTITHDHSYGNDRYLMYAHGQYSPWQIKFSELNTKEKRSIRQRLEEKTFYVYKYVFGGGTQTEYYLREVDTYKGDKGVLLK